MCGMDARSGLDVRTHVRKRGWTDRKRVITHNNVVVNFQSIPDSNSSSVPFNRMDDVHYAVVVVTSLFYNCPLLCVVLLHFAMMGNVCVAGRRQAGIKAQKLARTGGRP